MEKKKVVALLGFAPMTRGLAPLDDPDIEIWTLNEARMMGIKPKRINRLFQMHPRQDWENNVRDPGYKEWIAGLDCPIYMLEKEMDIPNSVRYPIEHITEKFGQNGRPYLTSTFSYQIALAIDEGYDEIQIFGIDLTAEEEYRYQRAGAEYLLGWAKAVGIKVTIPDDCPLLKGPLYGKYADAKTLFTQDQLQTRIVELNNQKAQAVANLNALEGAMQETINWQMKLLRDVNSNAGLEHKAFTGQVETVQNGAVVMNSDGTGHHTGIPEEVKV